MTICDLCQKEIVSEKYSPGYGTNEQGQKVCYTCCGVQDEQYMYDHNKVMLYLVQNTDESWQVTNWPGTLRIDVQLPRKGHHNIAGTRYDVWFTFAGKHWHGVQYGEWTQICHCKVIK